MGATYPEIIKLLKEEFEVKKTSKYSFCKATGINPTSVERYLCGISEPNQSSLQKLADYFGVSVAYLRGEVSYNEASRREEAEKIFEAIQRIMRRGNLSQEDMIDLDYVSTGFSALIHDAFKLEIILKEEDSRREALVAMRLNKELKEFTREFSREIDALADQYMGDGDTDKIVN